MSVVFENPAARLPNVRRRIPRYPIAVPVDITVLRSGVPATIPGRSLDVGEGGVAAVLSGELKAGEWVAVALQLPDAGQPLHTKAVVRHHGQMRCGLEFLGLSRDQRYMIRYWAGTALPDLPERESLPISFPPASLPSAMPQTYPRRQSLLSLLRSPQVHQLLGLTLAVFLAVAAAAAWQWHRGWRELEAQAARRDAHIRQPAARVPADVMEKLLIRKVEPTYPEAARRANLQGVVVLDAVVADDGSVVNVYPLRGPDALTPAAMDAARWWRFRPYRMNGEPATVETTLAVEFR